MTYEQVKNLKPERLQTIVWCVQRFCSNGGASVAGRAKPKTGGPGKLSTKNSNYC